MHLQRQRLEATKLASLTKDRLVSDKLKSYFKAAIHGYAKGDAWARGVADIHDRSEYINKLLGKALTYSGVDFWYYHSPYTYNSKFYFDYCTARSHGCSPKLLHHNKVL